MKRYIAPSRDIAQLLYRYVMAHRVPDPANRRRRIFSGLPNDVTQAALTSGYRGRTAELSTSEFNVWCDDRSHSVLDLPYRIGLSEVNFLLWMAKDRKRAQFMSIDMIEGCGSRRRVANMLPPKLRERFLAECPDYPSDTLAVEAAVASAQILVKLAA